MNRFVEAGMVLLAGAIVLPVVKLILEALNDEMVASVPGLTSFEQAIMGFYPLALLIAVIYAAILVVRGRKKTGE